MPNQRYAGPIHRYGTNLTPPESAQIDALIARADDPQPINQQLDELDALIKARREVVTQSMAAEECNCAACESGREYIRQSYEMPMFLRPQAS